MTQLTAQPAAPAARAQVEAFAEILSADPTYQAAWLGAIRQTAAQHFQRLGRAGVARHQAAVSSQP